MNLTKKESLRDDIYKAVEKVLNSHYEQATFADMIVPESLTEMVTNQAMTVFDNLQEYYSDLKDNGYLA